MRLEAKDTHEKSQLPNHNTLNFERDHFLQIYFIDVGISPEASDLPRTMKVAATETSWVAQLLNAVL